MTITLKTVSPWASGATPGGAVRPMRSLATRAGALGLAAGLLAAGIGFAVTLGPASDARAALMAYTDEAAFQTDLAAAGLTATTLDFDSLSAGDPIPSGVPVDGITFNYNFFHNSGSAQLAVTDGNQFGGGGPFDTTSPSNFLGTDDADILQSGDDIGLSFDDPVNAIGMFFISADDIGVSLFDGEIALSAGGDTALLDTSAVQQTLNDGSNVFFLGIIDDTATFSSASVTSFCCGAFFFNVDDMVLASAAAGPMVPVPEPASAPLFLVGLIGLWAASRRWRPAE